jgi:hypothetical protein
MIFATTLAACGEKASEKSPEEVVKIVLTELTSGDPEKAFEYMDVEYLSSKTGESVEKLKEQFFDEIKEARKRGAYPEGIEVKIKEVSINYEEKTATVEAAIINKKDNTEDTGHVELFKTNHGWKFRRL